MIQYITHKHNLNFSAQFSVPFCVDFSVSIVHLLANSISSELNKTILICLLATICRGLKAHANYWRYQRLCFP